MQALYQSIYEKKNMQANIIAWRVARTFVTSISERMVKLCVAVGCNDDCIAFIAEQNINSLPSSPREIYTLSSSSLYFSLFYRKHFILLCYYLTPHAPHIARLIRTEVAGTWQIARGLGPSMRKPNLKL